jgi:hypothetical protein
VQKDNRRKIYRKMNNSEPRQEYIDYWKQCDRIQKEYEKWYKKECARINAEWNESRGFSFPRKTPVYPSPFAKTPPFPEGLRDLT